MADAEDKNEDKGGPKFRFVGDPADDFSGPSSMSFRGMEFPKGEFVSVADEDIARRLRNHSHFEEEGGERVKRQNVEKDDLPALGLEAMKEVAKAEGVDFEDDTTKAKLMKAIRQHRKAQGNDDN